jgi:CDP-diacylglycerol---glycerol-3-phosphate 3-phosphatidyltransferase
MQSLNWKDICNFAGAITISRLFVAVAFPFFAHIPILAIILLLYGAVSDILDGVFARYFGTVSYTGGFVDGWIDKIFYINVAWSLVLFDYIPWWMALLMFSREWFQIPLVPYYVTRYLRGHRVPNKPHWSGKLASVTLVVAFCAGILKNDPILFCTSTLTSILGFWTAMIYLKREFEVINKFRYI